MKLFNIIAGIIMAAITVTVTAISVMEDHGGK